MKLLGSPKSKIANNGNCENMRYLEITEVIVWSVIRYFSYVFKSI